MGECETHNVEVSGLRGFLRGSARLPGWASGSHAIRFAFDNSHDGKRLRDGNDCPEGYFKGDEW